MTDSLAGKSRLQAWMVVAACFAVMFGAGNAHSSFSVFLPVLAREFAWSRGGISVAAAVSLLVGGVIGFWVGVATDRYGPRPILLGGAVVLGLGYFLASTIDALWHFYLLLGGLVGVGMAAMYLVTAATLSRWFVERRGLALGTLVAGLNLAYVTGGPLSAFLINFVGWRRTYRVLAGVVWTVVIPASLFMPVPLSGSSRATASAPEGATAREALADRRLWLLTGTWLLLGFTHMMVVIHMVSHVSDRGVTLEAASFALTIFGISMIGGGLLFGTAADRLGTRPVFWFCLVLQLATLTGALMAPPLSGLYLLIMCFGLGDAGTDTTVVKAASEVFGVRAIGAIIGILSIGWRLGAAFGPVAAGFIYDATGSYAIAFGLAALALALSFGCFTLGTSSLRRRFGVSG